MKRLCIFLCLVFVLLILCVTGLYFLTRPDGQVRLFGKIKAHWTRGIESSTPTTPQHSSNDIPPYTSTSHPEDIAVRIPVRKCNISKGKETNCEDFIGTLTYMNLGELLYAHAIQGDMRSVREYVEKYNIPPDLYHSKDGSTAIFGALDTHHFDIARLLLYHGADINQEFINGVPIFIYAVWKGDLEIVEWLLQYDANVNSLKDSNGDSLLDFAKKHFRKDPTPTRKRIVTILQQAGAQSAARRTRTLFGFSYTCTLRRQRNNFSQWSCLSDDSMFPVGFIETLEENLIAHQNIAKKGIQDWRDQFSPSAKEIGSWEQKCPEQESVYVYGKQVLQHREVKEHWVQVTPYSLLYVSMIGESKAQSAKAVMENLCRAWL